MFNVRMGGTALVVLAGLCACIAGSQPAASRILSVPGSYASIQKAIDEAVPGDTVQIQPGTYREALRFKDGIRLAGTERNRCVLSAPAAANAVISVARCAHGTIANLTVDAAGPAPGQAARSGIAIADASVEVRNCRIRSEWTLLRVARVAVDAAIWATEAGREAGALVGGPPPERSKR